MIHAIICGWGRAGKDALGNFIADHLGIEKPVSTSAFAGPKMWDLMLQGDDHPSLRMFRQLGFHRGEYGTFYQQRGMYREQWASWIDWYNREQPERLYAEMEQLGQTILVGIRRREEYFATIRTLQPTVTIWVRKPGVPKDITCEIEEGDCDFTVFNNRTLTRVNFVAERVAKMVAGCVPQQA